MFTSFLGQKSDVGHCWYHCWGYLPHESKESQRHPKEARRWLTRKKIQLNGMVFQSWCVRMLFSSSLDGPKWMAFHWTCQERPVGACCGALWRFVWCLTNHGPTWTNHSNKTGGLVHRTFLHISSRWLVTCYDRDVRSFGRPWLGGQVLRVNDPKIRPLWFQKNYHRLWRPKLNSNFGKLHEK